jgi:hypothetical protein
MRRPSLGVASLVLLAATLVAAVIVAGGTSGTGPAPQPYNSMPVSLLFDFEKPSEVRNGSIGFELPAEVIRSGRVEAALRFKMTKLENYPGGAQGDVRCLVEFRVNDQEWWTMRRTMDISSGDASQWLGPQDQATGLSSEGVWSGTNQRDITHLLHDGANAVSAYASCSSSVQSNGPTVVHVEVGPLVVTVFE